MGTIEPKPVPVPVRAAFLRHTNAFSDPHSHTGCGLNHSLIALVAYDVKCHCLGWGAHQPVRFYNWRDGKVDMAHGKVRQGPALTAALHVVGVQMAWRAWPAFPDWMPLSLLVPRSRHSISMARGLRFPFPCMNSVSLLVVGLVSWNGIYMIV